MDNLEKILKNNPEVFENSDLIPGHENRFLKKLRAQNAQANRPKKGFEYWKIAALIIPLALVAALIFSKPIAKRIWEQDRVMAMDPKLAEAEDYFSFAIQQKLDEVKAQQTPDNQALVEKAMHDLEKLETEYQKLVSDMNQSGANPQVIRAMLENFNLRIQVLEEVLQKIEWSNELKSTNYESSI